MKNFLGEFTVAVVLLALLFVVLNPWGVFMPTYLVMTILAAMAALFGVFAIFIWRENPADERERLHNLSADQMAFLAGSGFLLLGIVVGEFARQSDPWLILALDVMIIAKIAGLMYAKIKK
ncbi:MAG TPA: hypothetical protein VNG29_00650 [Candidatus Paceibacterota bacterium]|nr:hypothetical protein [Candidatus Paceibacterota bacterium]